MSKPSEWLSNHLIGAVYGGEEIVEFKSGSTWNDGGSWNTAIVKAGSRFWRVHMPSDYQSQSLDIDEVEIVMVPTFKIKGPNQ